MSVSSVGHHPQVARRGAFGECLSEVGVTRGEPFSLQRRQPFSVIRGASGVPGFLPCDMERVSRVKAHFVIVSQNVMADRMRYSLDDCGRHRPVQCSGKAPPVRLELRVSLRPQLGGPDIDLA